MTTWPRELVDDIAEVVRAVPGVASLSAGEFADIATTLPGRRVTGVRCTGTQAEVAVVLEWGAPAAAVVAMVRSRVAGLMAGPIHVTIADVSDPVAVDQLPTAGVPAEAMGAPG